MRKLIVALFGAVALMSFWAPEAGAQWSQRGLENRNFVIGPPGCVKVWSRRSRETRYGGAPRCRRIPV